MHGLVCKYTQTSLQGELNGFIKDLTGLSTNKSSAAPSVEELADHFAAKMKMKILLQTTTIIFLLQASESVAKQCLNH